MSTIRRRRRPEEAETLYEALALSDSEQYAQVVELWSAKNPAIRQLSIVKFTSLVDGLVKMNRLAGTESFPNRNTFKTRTESVKGILDGILPLEFLEAYPLSAKEYTLATWETSKNTFMFFVFITLLFGATTGIESGVIMFLVILSLLSSLHLNMYGALISARRWHAENLLLRAKRLDEVFLDIKNAKQKEVYEVSGFNG